MPTVVTPSRPRPSSRPSSRRGRGFTMPEAMLAVLIVGVGFLAVMELFSACTMENQRSSQVTIAQLLCTNIQELSAGLAFKDPYYSSTTWGAESGESLSQYNDIDDLDGLTFNPPIDSTRFPVTELSKYTQVVTVMPVDPNRPGNNNDTLKLEIGKGVYTGAVRVRVSVLYRNSTKEVPVEVLRSSWVRLDN